MVNETYFFREREQLELLVARILAPLVAAGVRPRLWSAACSTGEEPLTIAMLLAARGLLGQVDLMASDISTRALAIARARPLPPPLLAAGGDAPPRPSRS